MSRKTGFCIQHDAEGLGAVSVRASGQRWRVTDLCHVAADGEPPRSLQSAMANAVTPVTWLLADGEAHLTHVSMPKLRGKALHRAFTGALARDEGGQPDDWCVTWQELTLPGAAAGRAQKPHILYHADRKLVAEKVAVARQWGVELERALPGHLALDLFYRAYGPQCDEHAVWNLVFVSRQQQFLCVATRDAELVVRNLPANLSESADSGEYLDRLVTEIERSAFFARQTEYSPSVEKVIVCGDPDLAAPLAELLDEKSDTPAIHWCLEDMFEWGDFTPDADDYVMLAGAVLALQKVPFNLLPSRGRFHLNRRLRRQLLVAVGTTAATVVPLLVVGGVYTARVQDSYLVRAQSRLAVAQIRAQKAEDVYAAHRLLLSREDRIRRFAHTRPDFESVLLRLAALTPAEVVFKKLQVQEQQDGSFQLRLQGESRAVTGHGAQKAFLKLMAAIDHCDFLERQGDPQLMRMMPGLEPDASGQQYQTTVFDFNMKWHNSDEGAG